MLQAPAPTTAVAAPKDLAQLADAIETELMHNDQQKHLPLHKKTNLQALLECVPLSLCLSIDRLAVVVAVVVVHRCALN